MTTIHISEENWKIMNSLKQPGESINDVVTRLLKLTGYNDAQELDERDFDHVLEDFIEIVNSDDPSIEEVIEQSRSGWNA